MTREEARKIFEDKCTEIDNPYYTLEDIREAWNLAIEALKEERHGEWINDNASFGFVDLKCSFCHSEFLDVDHLDKWNFCPSCGARLRGEAK